MKKLLCLVLALAMMLPLVASADPSILNTEGEMPIVNQELTLSIFGKQGAIHADWATMDFFTK